eukprot:scaffold109308_cov33-Tisochrysis_lutea.AAC.2
MPDAASLASLPEAAAFRKAGSELECGVLQRPTRKMTVTIASVRSSCGDHPGPRAVSHQQGPAHVASASGKKGSRWDRSMWTSLSCCPHACVPRWRDDGSMATRPNRHGARWAPLGME